MNANPQSAGMVDRNCITLSRLPAEPPNAIRGGGFNASSGPLTCALAQRDAGDKLRRRFGIPIFKYAKRPQKLKRYPHAPTAPTLARSAPLLMKTDDQ
jgi:hypothetical protein